MALFELPSPWEATLRPHAEITGHLGRDVTRFLTALGCPTTARHVADVAAEVRRLALRFGLDADAAEAAGWLHDVSDVLPKTERLAAARDFGLEVLPEEASHPSILHQKLSVVLSEALFGVHDPSILSAVGCHTTLKPGASLLDKILFVADKMAWDQPGVPPYRDALERALDVSLDAAARDDLRRNRV